MSMRPRRMGQVVDAARAAIGFGLLVFACGNDSPQCVSSNNPDGGLSDDGGDTGAGFLRSSGPSAARCAPP